MLLQTNSYIVPKDKRAEHARILRRFRQTLLRLGCDHFEVYEQVGANWNTGETTGRFVQIMRFRDRKHQLAVQSGERADPQAQQVVREFTELINFPYQQQQGLFAVGYYTSFLRMPPQRTVSAEPTEDESIPTGIVAPATETSMQSEIPPTTESPPPMTLTQAESETPEGETPSETPPPSPNGPAANLTLSGNQDPSHA